MPKKDKKERMAALKSSSSNGKKPEIKKVESKTVTVKPYKRKLAPVKGSPTKRKGMYSERTGEYYSTPRQRANAEKALKGGTEVGDYNPRTKKKQTY